MVFNFFKRKKEETIVTTIEPQKKPEPRPELPNYKKPKEEIIKKADEKIINVMKNIKDPELNIDIWTLELIYDIDVNDKNIEVKMTFTSPMCPYGPQLVDSVKTELKKLEFEDPKVEVVFSPPWQPSDEVKEILGVPY